MGRKTKTERFSEKENFEWGKTQMVYWGLTRFWTLCDRWGIKKCEFQKRGERMEKIIREGQGSIIGK